MIKTGKKTKFTHGGFRIAGPGKKIGRKTEIGTNPRVYADYLDIETIDFLKKIHPIRSIAIRKAAKAYFK